MVSSKNFDMTANIFEDEVFTATDDNQKAKLLRTMNHFNKIGSFKNKRKPNVQSNNLKPKKMKLSAIHNSLPPELLEKILTFLNYKEICQSQLICRKWKEVIENGKLLKKASGKFLA